MFYFLASASFVVFVFSSESDKNLITMHTVYKLYTYVLSTNTHRHTHTRIRTHSWGEQTPNWTRTETPEYSAHTYVVVEVKCAGEFWVK